jgi:hypothetical protein
MSSRTMAAVVMMAVAWSSTAPAQTPPAAQPPDMAQMLESMLPMMTRMMESTIDIQLKAAEKPETAQRLARFKRQLYEALLRQGFAKEDALQIVIHTLPPSAVPSGK